MSKENKAGKRAGQRHARLSFNGMIGRTELQHWSPVDMQNVPPSSVPLQESSTDSCIKRGGPPVQLFDGRGLSKGR
jgi:hypothetical protein